MNLSETQRSALRRVVANLGRMNFDNFIDAGYRASTLGSLCRNGLLNFVGTDLVITAAGRAVLEAL